MASQQNTVAKNSVHALSGQNDFSVQAFWAHGWRWMAVTAFCVLVGSLPFGCAHNERPARILPLETQVRFEWEEVKEPVEEPVEEPAEEHEVQFRDGYILPVIHPSPRFSSTFGASRRGGRVHKGVDLEVPAGTPVVAARCGEVRFAGWHGAYGNIIVVCHGDGFETAYAHLKENQAREGESVQQGQQIGLVGQTGNATANHLHFEIRRDGERVDPSPKLLLAAE